MLTAPQLDRDKTGLLKHAQVLRDRRPGVLEPGGDGAGGHFPAAGMDDRQYGPPRPVCGVVAEHRIEVVELGQTAWLGRHVPSATRS